MKGSMADEAMLEVSADHVYKCPYQVRGKKAPHSFNYVSYHISVFHTLKTTDTEIYRHSYEAGHGKGAKRLKARCDSISVRAVYPHYGKDSGYAQIIKAQDMVRIPCI